MKQIKTFFQSARVTLAALPIIALAGCVAPPYYAQTSTILSRLPSDQTGTAPTLTPEQKKQYAEIDKQVMRDQDRDMQAQAAARAAASAYNSTVSVYGGWSPGWYGYSGYGYYGGYGGWYGNGWYGSYYPGAWVSW